jgi:hypothetical protein
MIEVSELEKMSKRAILIDLLGHIREIHQAHVDESIALLDAAARLPTGQFLLRLHGVIHRARQAELKSYTAYVESVRG